VQSHTRYFDAAISNPQSTLEYNMVIQRIWVTAAGKNFAFKIAFKIAVKLLQTETLLLLTAYKNSSAPYPKAPSLTPL